MFGMTGNMFGTPGVPADDTIRPVMRKYLIAVVNQSINAGKCPAQLGPAIINWFDAQYPTILSDFNTRFPQPQVTEQDIAGYMPYVANLAVQQLTASMSGGLGMANPLANPLAAMNGGMVPNYHAGFGGSPQIMLPPMGGNVAPTNFGTPPVGFMPPGNNGGPQMANIGAYGNAPSPQPAPQPQAPAPATTNNLISKEGPDMTNNALQIIEQISRSDHEVTAVTSQHQLGACKILTINGAEEMVTMDATNCIPWNYETDAIRDTMMSLKKFFNTPRWVALIRWYELFGVKSSGEGLTEAATHLQTAIADKSTNSAYPLYKCFLDQMSKLPSNLSEHFKSKTLLDFNKFMRRFSISSNDQRYPTFANWEEVEELFITDNKYPVLAQKYKYEYDGMHPFPIRILVALKTVLGSYFSSEKYFFDPIRNPSPCAYAKGVHFYIENYSSRDYGIIPEKYKELYTTQLSDYVVHAVMRLCVVSNFGQSATDAKMANAQFCSNAAHHVMFKMFNVPALADWVVMDKKGSEIVKRHEVGLTMDDQLVIL